MRGNTDRDYELSREDTVKVIEACPNTQWKLLVALSRFGGLRCPSEYQSLRWGDIDWAHERFMVHSRKTKRHKPSALVPLYPELLPYFEAAWDQADEGSEFVIDDSYRNHKNLATQLKRIIKRVGLTPWPKLWHNMRITRQNELQREYPIHVVCEWMGNSPRVAQHYLKVSESDFARASAARVREIAEPGGKVGWHRVPPSKIPANSAV